jgi:hypothetical protein
MLKQIVTLVHGIMGCQFTALFLLMAEQALHNAKLLLVKYTQAFRQAVLNLLLSALQPLLKRQKAVRQTLVEQEGQSKKPKLVAMEQLHSFPGNFSQTLAY